MTKDQRTYLNYDDCLNPDDASIKDDIYTKWIAEVAEIRSQIDGIIMNHPLVTKDVVNQMHILKSNYLHIYRSYGQRIDDRAGYKGMYFDGRVYIIEFPLPNNHDGVDVGLFALSQPDDEDIAEPTIFRNGNWRLALDELSMQAYDHHEKYGSATATEINEELDSYAHYDIFIPEQIENGMPEMFQERVKQTGDPDEVARLLEQGWKLGELKHVKQASAYDTWMSALLYLPKD